MIRKLGFSLWALATLSCGTNYYLTCKILLGDTSVTCLLLFNADVFFKQPLQQEVWIRECMLQKVWINWIFLSARDPARCFFVHLILKESHKDYISYMTMGKLWCWQKNHCYPNLLLLTENQKYQIEFNGL